ncbi:hypothetical protein WJX84_003147 [Apatococcus fuscideae]|uniref:GST N-terminal domain-containing protein n=1 Tax=Apatococcus fuscideae TaxID=2026836 RepID=A0AAW1SN40_9CHLO
MMLAQPQLQQGATYCLPARVARPVRCDRRNMTIQAATGTTDAAPAKNFKLVGSGPKPFQVNPSQLLTIAAAAFPMLIRFGSGGFAAGYSTKLEEDDGKYGPVKVSGRKVSEQSQTGSFKRPSKLIEIYEFEGCPFCRKVREAVSILDLDVAYYPCPAGGPTWREKVKKMGGKASFPYMVDPNTGKSMYESDAIVRHLFQNYGDGKVPWGLSLGILTALSCTLALLPRLGAGSRYAPSKLPKQPLELWAYEMSPFCKVVREKLVSLEIPFVQHTVSRGSPKRQLLVDKYGKFAAPYLEDPNQRVAMFESGDIIQYLQETYAAS